MEMPPNKIRFTVDVDKFLTLERDPVTNITHIDLHDSFMATTTRLASFIDGKFQFYTNNSTSRFIDIMRAQPELKDELNQIAIPQHELQPLKDKLNSFVESIRTFFRFKIVKA
jgi:hypothetical protein